MARMPPRLRPLIVCLLLAGAQAPAAAQSSPPFEFMQAALARHRIVFLGDIHPLAEPKLLVSRLIREQEPGASIDLLALEVASEQQEAIDRYLSSTPEDTTILLDHPRTLRSYWGASVEYLDIYRAVYQWNRVHPEHPVHVLAADLRGWPISPLTEHMATGGFVNRDVWMAAAFRKVLDQHPDWRTSSSWAAITDSGTSGERSSWGGRTTGSTAGSPDISRTTAIRSTAFCATL